MADINTPWKVFGTDKKAEAETGVVLDYGDWKIRIVRAGGNNKKFERMFKTRFAPYQRQLAAGTMSNEVALKMMAELYADAIVIGWESKNKEGNFVEGIHDENGDIQPVNHDNIVKLFVALPDHFKDVQDQADKLAVWRIETLQEGTKN